MTKPMIIARWSIDENGDVHETFDGSGLVTVYHTGDEQMARKLIAERHKVVESIHSRITRETLERIAELS